MDYYNQGASSSMYDVLFGTTSIIIWLAIIAFFIIVNWKLFEKFGEPGWKAIIPFYNLYILYKYTFGVGWVFLALLIPFVNIVISIILCVKLGKVFGKGGGFILGLIFIPIVFQPILAFDSSKYMPENI